MASPDRKFTRVYVTGTAGFVGFHLARLLLAEGLTVHGFDGMTDYYDVRLKERRHAMLLQSEGFSATVGMLEDLDLLRRTVTAFKPDVIVHLAAQAGVGDFVEADGEARDGHLGLARVVRTQHRRVVHAIDVICSQNQCILGWTSLQKIKILMQGICSAFVPGITGPHLWRDHGDEFTAFGTENGPSIPQMPLQGLRFVLCQNQELA